MDQNGWVFFVCVFNGGDGGTEVEIRLDRREYLTGWTTGKLLRMKTVE